MPVILSSLLPSGQWTAIQESSVVELEEHVFGQDSIVMSKVIGATNRGNVELTMAMYHSKIGGQIAFIDIETNQRMKYL